MATINSADAPPLPTEKHPPFPINVHIVSPAIDSEGQNAIEELRGLLQHTEEYRMYQEWCTDEQLHRFLIARLFHVTNAYDMLISALRWRVKRIPPEGIESLYGWEERMSHEGSTGKMYIPGVDHYNRPVIVADDSAQNTVDEDGRLTFVAWCLDYACRLMVKGVDKFVTFIHFENFSIFGGPSMKALQESIFMATTAFPERLGHCIIYRPPTAFKFLWNALTPFLDSKTLGKIKFITGSVEDGTPNDMLLKEIIGGNWKTLCGAEQPVRKRGNSPGYDHDSYWSMSMARHRNMTLNEQSARLSKESVERKGSGYSENGVIEPSDNVWASEVSTSADNTNPQDFARLLEQLAVVWGTVEDTLAAES
jgi:hypothetical protein